MPLINHQIRLVSRPSGTPTLSNFALTSEPVPEPGPGQVLVRNHFLSLDPYMRGRMDDRKSYAPAQKLNEVMTGGTVGEVVASTIERFQPGDTVLTTGGWQEYLLLDAAQLESKDPRTRVSLTKVDASRVPLSAYLGALGMPGVTAWVGVNEICAPRAGETLVVSSAAGAVGSVVGQLAKARGCRVVGIAGGALKTRYVVEELGFDECIDYREHSSFSALAGALGAAAPKGVDCYFENVGGLVLDAVLSVMNDFGRIALCGLISGYDGEPIPIKNPSAFLVKRLKLQGFIVTDQLDLWPAALKELSTLMAAGKLRYRESVAEGLANAPQAFLGLLKGENFGKQLVKLI
jgi:NADPH-dependent curcumin reductase